MCVGETYNMRYLVRQKLGWGHFSTVWLCSDLTCDAHVALKARPPCLPPKSRRHAPSARVIC